MTDLNNLVPFFQGYIALCAAGLIVWIFNIYKRARAREFAMLQLKVAPEQTREKIEHDISSEVTRVRNAPRYLVDSQTIRDMEIELISAWLLKEHFAVPREEIVLAVERLRGSATRQEEMIAALDKRVSELGILSRTVIREVYRSEFRRFENLGLKKLAAG